MFIRNMQHAFLVAFIAAGNSVHKLSGPGGTRPPDSGYIDRYHSGAATTTHSGSFIEFFDDEGQYWEEDEELEAQADMSPNFDVLYSLFHCVGDAASATPDAAPVSTSTKVKVSPTHGSIYYPGFPSFGPGYAVCPAQATSATAQIPSVFPAFFDLSKTCPSRLAILRPRPHPSTIEPASCPSIPSTIEFANVFIEPTQMCYLDEAPVKWSDFLVQRLDYSLTFLRGIWRELKSLVTRLLFTITTLVKDARRLGLVGIWHSSAIFVIRFCITLIHPIIRAVFNPEKIHPIGRAAYSPGKTIQAMVLCIWQLSAVSVGRCYGAFLRSIIYVVYNPVKTAQAILHFCFVYKFDLAQIPFSCLLTMLKKRNVINPRLMSLVNSRLMFLAENILMLVVYYYTQTPRSIPMIVLKEILPVLFENRYASSATLQPALVETTNVGYVQDNPTKEAGNATAPYIESEDTDIATDIRTTDPLITDDSSQVIDAEQTICAPMSITSVDIVENQFIFPTILEDQSIPAPILVTGEALVERTTATIEDPAAPIPVIDEAIVEHSAAIPTPDLDTMTAYDGALAPLTSAVESAIDSKLQDIVSPTASIYSVDSDIDHDSLDSSQMHSFADEAEQSLITEDSHNDTEMNTKDAHTIMTENVALALEASVDLGDITAVDEAEEQKVDFKTSEQILPFLTIDKHEPEDASPSPISEHRVSRAVILVDFSMDLLDIDSSKHLVADVKDITDNSALSPILAELVEKNEPVDTRTPEQLATEESKAVAIPSFQLVTKKIKFFRVMKKSKAAYVSENTSVDSAACTPSTEAPESATSIPAVTPDVDMARMTARQMEKSPARASDDVPQNLPTVPDTSSPAPDLSEVPIALLIASIPSSSSSSSSSRPETPIFTDDTPVASGSGSSVPPFTPEGDSLQTQLSGSVKEHQDEDVQASPGIETAMDEPMPFPLTKKQAGIQKHLERQARTAAKKAREKEERQRKRLQQQAEDQKRKAEKKELERKAGLERGKQHELIAQAASRKLKAEKAERHRLYCIDQLLTRLKNEELDEDERHLLEQRLLNDHGFDIHQSGSTGDASTSNISQDAPSPDDRVQEEGRQPSTSEEATIQRDEASGQAGLASGSSNDAARPTSDASQDASSVNASDDAPSPGSSLDASSTDAVVLLEQAQLAAGTPSSSSGASA